LLFLIKLTEGLIKEKNKRYGIFLTKVTFAIESRIFESVFSYFPNSEFEIKSGILGGKKIRKKKTQASIQALHDYSITLSLLRLDKSLASFLVLIVCCCFALLALGEFFFLALLN
jgi:hypothetical protein